MPIWLEKQNNFESSNFNIKIKNSLLIKNSMLNKILKKYLINFVFLFELFIFISSNNGLLQILNFKYFVKKNG